MSVEMESMLKKGGGMDDDDADDVDDNATHPNQSAQNRSTFSDSMIGTNFLHKS